MNRPILPFMGTHIANIALNPQLGLIFLWSDPQRTHGLTEVSHETMLNDQLQVARWMIMNFLDEHGIHLESHPCVAWTKIRDYEPVMNEFPDQDTVDHFTGICETIMEQVTGLGDQLWDHEDGDAVTFLARLAKQMNLIVGFTNQRIEIIKCMAEINPDDHPVIIQEQIMRLGPERAIQISQAFGVFGRSMGIATMGYVAVKNGMSAERIFARQLLEVARKIVSPEAVKRGYTAP